MYQRTRVQGEHSLVHLLSLLENRGLLTEGPL